MATRIQLATTPDELHQVFRLRHEVFVEEEGYMPPRDDREVSDRYDHSERSLILMALVDGELAGTARLTLDGGLGTSADEYHDFAPFIAEPPVRVGTGSQLCVHRRHRASRALYQQLLSGFYHAASTFGLTRLKAVFNPEVGRLFAQAGWKPAGGEFLSEKCGLPCLPMTLELSQLSLRFRNYVQRHQRGIESDPMIRQFHATGETILDPNTPVSESFEIVSGTVEVHTTSPTGEELVQHLTAGDTLAAFGNRLAFTATALDAVELIVNTTSSTAVRAPRLPALAAA